MSRINLKLLSELRQGLSLTNSIDTGTYTDINNITDKYKLAQFSGENKPVGYGEDEEYTNLLKLGPIVDQLVTAVKALEDEIQNLHGYIEGQLGNAADVATLPPTLNFLDSNNDPVNVITFDPATANSSISLGGGSQINAENLIDTATVSALAIALS